MDRRQFIQGASLLAIAPEKVRLNGEDLGVLWNAPYRIDTIDALKECENMLLVTVINVWTNRLIGDEYHPSDSDRDPLGVIKTSPQLVADRQKSPTGRFTSTSARQREKDNTLLASGLLGTVQLIAAEKSKGRMSS